MKKEKFNLIEHLKRGKCKHCQAGDFGKCKTPKSKARAFAEAPDGTREYFCCVACALLASFSEEEMEHVVPKFYNDAGHAEQMRSLVDDAKPENIISTTSIKEKDETQSK